MYMLTLPEGATKYYVQACSVIVQVLLECDMLVCNI